MPALMLYMEEVRAMCFAPCDRPDTTPNLSTPWVFVCSTISQSAPPVADHPVNRVHELLPWNLAGVRQRLDQRDAA